METLLINEQFVSQFKYWQAGQIRTGMRFRNNLFEHVAQFKANQRPQAFELAWKLTQAGQEAIVTASTAQYTVWVSLRSKELILPIREQPQIAPFEQVTPDNQQHQLKIALSA
ncbi:MAG: hypothetical protein KME07_01400 [Pegethrix bostrychoides GSE-TBD4-15B]|jgi:hypothetical protein|uniref:Uncharacterized protein n=1 Tax=Pegethrix bostrychoides GSE-TBD4-15B TaxID=2839662 RepID=A0A951P7T5_9CYAN|nr:hypothetical protein [Pegethrix bostrychoides GSE-TBD4-15B]